MKAYITKLHIVFEILALLISLVSLVIVIVWASGAGPEVAIHFDFSGNPDGYGSLYSFISLPIVFLVMNIVMSLMVNFMPTTAWNIPFTVKPECTLIVFRDISFIIVFMAFIFSLFSLGSSLIDITGKNELFLPLMIMFFVLLTIDVVGGCIIAKKHNSI